jgi:heterodisulfide reductase subunit B2
MRLAYFPGCAATGTGRELDSSTRAACAAYGLELVDIPGWVCCGASAAHMTGEKLALALPARSLAAARALGVEGVLTPCAACYNRLSLTERAMAESATKRSELATLVEADLDGDLPVYHVLQAFSPEQVAAKRKGTLAPLKVACYYGCLLTRPREISVDPDTVNPSCLDDLVRAAGLMPVEWPFRTECCGASLVMARPESVARLSTRLLDAAQKSGAEALVVACPLCHANLDLKQPTFGRAGSLPVLYLTEVLALALGVPEARLELKRHTAPVPALTR